jgi:alpha-1,2-glucosyltransferase
VKRPSADEIRIVAAFAFLIVMTVVVHHALRPLGRYSDEIHHYRQIRGFCDGDLTLNPRITTIPGYHVVSAAVGRMTGDCSAEQMRLVNAVIGALSVAAFFAAVRAAGSQVPIARTLQYFFLPILLPYHFLIYADSISLLADLVTMALLLRGRFALAGLAGSLAILVRQTNVVWLVLVCAVALAEAPEVWDEPRPLEAGLRRTWTALLGLVGFAGFVVWNGGIAVGGRGAFAAGLHTGNVFLFLALYFVLFLPANLFALRRRWERLGDKLLWALVLGVYLVFLGTFRVDHPFNKFEGFLRNEMLSAVATNLALKHVFFVFAAGGLASLYVTRLRRPALYLVYPLALATLLPLRLIEHRYGLAAFVLLLVCREDDPPRVEAAGVGLSMLLAGVLLYGLARGLWML